MWWKVDAETKWRWATAIGAQESYLSKIPCREQFQRRMCWPKWVKRNLAFQNGKYRGTRMKRSWGVWVGADVRTRYCTYINHFPKGMRLNLFSNEFPKTIPAIYTARSRFVGPFLPVNNSTYYVQCGNKNSNDPCGTPSTSSPVLFYKKEFCNALRVVCSASSEANAHLD